MQRPTAASTRRSCGKVRNFNRRVSSCQLSRTSRASAVGEGTHATRSLSNFGTRSHRPHAPFGTTQLLTNERRDSFACARTAPCTQPHFHASALNDPAPRSPSVRREPTNMCQPYFHIHELLTITRIAPRDRHHAYVRCTQQRLRGQATLRVASNSRLTRGTATRALDRNY